MRDAGPIINNGSTALGNMIVKSFDCWVILTIIMYDLQRAADF